MQPVSGFGCIFFGSCTAGFVRLCSYFYYSVKKKDNIFLALIAGVLTLLVQCDPFFWDTVQLASKHAHFFHENGLKWSVLPESIDSGHPPALGYYLAFCWTIFGKSLFVSHWAMFPFLWLNITILWRIAVRVTGRELAAFAFPVFIADPVWFTQHILCSPDVLVFSGILLVIQGHFSKNSITSVLGVLLLSVSSMRGMMTAAALGFWELLLLAGPLFSFSRAFRILAAYIPGAVLAAVFLWWHWLATGWTGYHAGSPWASAFQRTDMAELLRNILIVGWRWLDFGRAGVWILFGVLLWQNRRRMRDLYAGNREWVLLFVCLLIFLTPSALIYRNLSAHRYFLPVFYSFSLLAVALLASGRAFSVTIKKVSLLLVVLFLVSGHYWIYPFGVSSDWDCTVVHRQFHALRREAVIWLDEAGADFSETGTEFPILNSGEMVELNGDTRKMSEYEPGNNRWVITSNISNDFSQETERNLAESMELAWEKYSWPLWIKIYRATDSGESR